MTSVQVFASGYLHDLNTVFSSSQIVITPGALPVTFGDSAATATGMSSELCKKTTSTAAAIKVAVHGVTNVLDGGTGSNFLTGGNGVDTFFLDDRVATADLWSTVVGFHGGDAATVWGVTPQDFKLQWLDNQGASGFSGLTLGATAVGKPNANLTLAGYSSVDLNNGRLSVTFGTDPGSGSNYMLIQAH